MLRMVVSSAQAIRGEPCPAGDAPGVAVLLNANAKKVNARIDQLKKQFYGGSDAKYKKTLQQQGLTEDQAKQEVRAQLISEELYKKVTANVKVSQKEIQAYYDDPANAAQYTAPESASILPPYKWNAEPSIYLRASVSLRMDIG